MHDGAFYHHPQPTLNPWWGREIQPETPANENRRIHLKTELECTTPTPHHHHPQDKVMAILLWGVDGWVGLGTDTMEI